MEVTLAVWVIIMNKIIIIIINSNFRLFGADHSEHHCTMDKASFSTLESKCQD